MNRTTEEFQDNQNGSANAGEDSTTMTIEYLRARLHSERSVSKATRERADELAKWVAELEEQLKVASLQRKKAEKATLGLLALLENHGIGEISDQYDSDSELEESLYEPNVDKSNSVLEEERYVSSKRKEGSSGSEHESTPSTGRSLSWKSSKDSSCSCGRKYFDPSICKHSNFEQSASSSRHRLGKSCRELKRREIRSTAEESIHESTSPNVHGGVVADHLIHTMIGLDSRPEELSKCSGSNGENAQFNEQFSVSSRAEGQVSGANVSIQKHTCDGEMERALQHQPHLIGRYEAEEKAQREWEEKYMGNSCNIPDSCEPGNQSDVTEERDETKAMEPSPTETIAANNSSYKSKEEPSCFGKQTSITHIDSFKFSPNADTESSHNFNINDVHCCRTSAADFAFPVVSETRVPMDNHVTSSLVQCSPPHPQCQSPCSHAVSIDGGHDSLQAEKTPSDDRSKEHAIIPHEGPQRLDGVLDALQQAKQLLEQNISSLPSKEVRSVGTAAETSLSAMRDVERMKIAVGSAALFRVPTDFQSEASYPQTTLLGSGYPLRLNDYCDPSSVPLTRDDQYLLHSVELKPSTFFLDQFFRSMPSSTESRVSSSKQWYVTSLPSSSGFTTYSSESTYPDVIPRLSSSELFTVQSPSRS